MIFKEIMTDLTELAHLKQLCKKKTELLSTLQSCKAKEYEEIWLLLHKALEERTPPDKLLYDAKNSTLLFREENDRQYLLTCINFICIYLQHLANSDKKRKKHIKLDANFYTLFYKLSEVQFMLSDREVRMSFGKCLFQLCELNLEENEFSEHVKVNLLIFLLWKTCSSEGKSADVTKLKKNKDLCKYIKWGVPEKSTNSFYLLCSYSLNLPKFYAHPDGKFFLAHVWSQHESIASHLFHKFVHNTVLLTHDSISHYSQIIHSTWKNCEGMMKETLEMQIEHLVNLALKCPIKVAARFRNVLSIFHNNKGDKSINNLIFKIYDPVIWRSLMSPNWKLRFNATCIFQLIFPVVDPCIKNVNYLASMEKAYHALLDLAEDVNACVLQAVAKCICHILNELWEIISEQKRSALVEVLINKLLRDRQYDNVKVEVLLGFCEMAKNKKIHKLFGKIFHKIKYLINDKSLRVRKNCIALILELNKQLNENLSNQIDFTELMKRVTKDLFTYNVQLCIRKLSYAKYEHHERVKNREMSEFLKLSCNLITYSMWECSIKEQAKKCVNLLNDYPALMICISKFATNMELVQRYKLASVLFEITNVKLGEEGNSVLLTAGSTGKGRIGEGFLVGATTGTMQTPLRDVGKLLDDPVINGKYVKYASLLLCVAYLLKPKNEEEMEMCGSEKMENFLRSKFKEDYFLTSIDTLMQQFYFKILKYVNLNQEDYVGIHSYARRQLLSLHRAKNEHACRKFILPLFHKWSLLESVVSAQMHILNASIEFVFLHTCADPEWGLAMKGSPFLHADGNHPFVEKAALGYFADGEEEHQWEIPQSEEGSEIKVPPLHCDKKDDHVEENEKKRIHINDQREKEKIHISDEKEINALILLSLIVKKKKYHNMLFKSFQSIIHNVIFKFNSYLLSLFDKLTQSDFQLPPHFISPHYEDKGGFNFVQLVLHEKAKIKGYFHLYISFFFLCYTSKKSNFPHDWDTLIDNTLRSIHLISSVKFKNEIEIVTSGSLAGMTAVGEAAAQGDARVDEWATYTKTILHFVMHFLDMVEFTVAMKMTPIEDLDFSDLVKNVFMFYKCYELVRGGLNGQQKHRISGHTEGGEPGRTLRDVYLEVWTRVSEFLLFLLNFDYFEKKTEMKLSILYPFFLFTYEVVHKEHIERVMNKYAALIKERETFFGFVKNYKKNNSMGSYMRESQVNYIQGILDNISLPKEKAKKRSS
ncbi:hypothetical protein C922_00307 [Plasmodium inui San Antonio 1]|uniref:Condensin-2 complex subunit G2 n=1 Tax=Plasmodium inui San Antonio 1 TaxID=1237626 RepID=W7AKX0_9APIC|nr:hypothetical protein C922_00307 [Plasmodium inui San Antonio 1]EUD69444.1 hypothetical protein C922_00307 [Plasmodium inui San Antonio 1]